MIPYFPITFLVRFFKTHFGRMGYLLEIEKCNRKKKLYNINLVL